MRRPGIMAVAAALGLAVLLWAADRMFPPALDRYEARSLELVAADGTLLNASLTRDGMVRLLATPDSVSPRYLELLLATEDRRFWRHSGVDPLALLRASWQVLRHGHVVSGGSTLTMQAARLLTPHRRTLLGKLQDILRALQLEAHLSKRQILSIYLTLAPMGGNIEGVRAASLIYFEREPARLTEAQAALLAALPRSPTRLRPDRHLDRAAAAAYRVLDRAGAGGSDTVTMPRTIVRHALPAHAPHLLERLAGAGQHGRVATTLDAGLQALAEELVARELPWLGDKANVAALVIRNRDRAALAYLGGADWLAPGGMVDMVRARRSPGSTLKPFIYGLALDDALILPTTLIEDAPMRIGDYAPQNFDHDFHGTVTAAEALQQSYNLPAVALLNDVGPVRFAAHLRQAGITLALPQRTLEPGLPIALGGVGISLEDLASLYVGLADGGGIAPLRLLAGAPPAQPTPLLTAAAARRVGDMLRGTPLPDGVAPARERPVAYKTGTSYGFRDAWAVGYSPLYTAAVWVGRTEGSPRPGAFGRAAAAPILFKLLDLLPPEPGPLPAAASAPPGPLAPALRHYIPNGADGATLRILYPPAKATLSLAEGADAAAPIALEAAGGKPPYRWAVNGLPLPPTARGRTASWLPDGPGFVRLSVTDGDNHATSEEIRLR
jgi:penicillin-binding protein 1C